MTIKIGSNIASLQAQRRIGEATSSLEKIYERLSSGQRINRASDDAAGLAIAQDLNVKSRVFTQAIRNGNDGISILSIADSAIDTLSGIVIRIRELAEQSANGTYSTKQRDALDNEAQALTQEFARISKTTSFNGVKLFDGSLGSGLRLQLGFGVEGSINASVGGSIGIGAAGSAVSYTAESRITSAVAMGDLDGDGNLDMVTAGYSDSNDGYVTVRFGTGTGAFGSAVSYSSESRLSADITLGDLNGDGILDLVTTGRTDANTGLTTVRLGTGSGSFGSSTSYTVENYSKAVTLGDLNGDGILDLVTAGYVSGSTGFATVRLGSGNGTFGTSRSYTTEATGSFALALGDINGDGVLDLITAGYNYYGDGYNGNMYDGYASIRLGSGNGSFGAATQYDTESSQTLAVAVADLNGDGFLDLVTAGTNDITSGVAGGAVNIRLGNGNGSFGAAIIYTADEFSSDALSLKDLNGDGILDMVTAGRNSSGGSVTMRLGFGNGTFGSATTYTTNISLNALNLADLNGDSVLDFVAAGAIGSNGFASIRLGQTKDGIAPLLDFTLKTKVGAKQAIGLLLREQDNLSRQRGVIGANQSRIGIALNNLASSKENFITAEARIRDADVAVEAGNLVRTQILQQAASSVLAQANQAPQLALILLR